MCMRVCVCKCECVWMHAEVCKCDLGYKTSGLKCLKRTAFQKRWNITTALKQKALSGRILTSAKYKHSRGEHNSRRRKKKRHLQTWIKPRNHDTRLEHLPRPCRLNKTDGDKKYFYIGGSIYTFIQANLQYLLSPQVGNRFPKQETALQGTRLNRMVQSSLGSVAPGYISWKVYLAQSQSPPCELRS